MLKAQGLRSVRDGQEILASVDVTVEPGESLAVTGPSGSGKTTLLALLSGLARPTAGEVYIDGKPLTKFAGPALGVAVVLQGYGLVSLLTAAENVEIALRAAGRSPSVASRTAREVLAHLGLETHADQLVEELSGGQQQRTAVARALALEPRLLIADEPTAELDPVTRAVALARMFEVAINGGSLILATHDPEVAAKCDRILDLSAGGAGLRPRSGQALGEALTPGEVPAALTPGATSAAPPPADQPAPGEQDRGPGRRSGPWRKPAHALPEPLPSAKEEESKPAAPGPVHLPPQHAAPTAAEPGIPPGQREPGYRQPGWPQPASPRSGPPGAAGQQSRPTVPPGVLSAQREPLPSSALPTMHRRAARLREYLEEVRRRAYNASSWPGTSGRQARQLGDAELNPGPAAAGADELEFLSRARDDLAGFADLGLRLLELHQPMGLGASTGNPSSSVPRCLSCMWRWPCPTFLTLAEIMETGRGQE